MHTTLGVDLRYVLARPVYTIQTMHHVTSCKSHIRKVHAWVAVTCHLHFWQNDRDRLRVTAVTRGWKRIPKQESAQKVDPGEKKYSPRSSCWDSNPRSFNHESSAVTIALSYPRSQIHLFADDFSPLQENRLTTGSPNSPDQNELERWANTLGMRF